MKLSAQILPYRMKLQYRVKLQYDSGKVSLESVSMDTGDNLKEMIDEAKVLAERENYDKKLLWSYRKEYNYDNTNTICFSSKGFSATPRNVIFNILVQRKDKKPIDSTVINKIWRMF